MSNAFNVRQKHESVPSNLRPLAALVAGLFIAASGSVYAADQATSSATSATPTVEQLQAEIARLKQIIATQLGATTNTPAASQVSAPEPKKDAAKEEESQTLGEITVSGTSRLVAVQDVPTSISVVSGSDLAELNAFSIGSILKRASNVQWNTGNQRTASLSIRGIGKIGTTEAQDPSVGVTVDGVSYAYNALTSAYDFTDVDTLEVLRGPQGSLGGKSANIGVVNISTVRPSFTPSTDYSLTFGQLGTVIATLAAGGPIIDDVLAWRGSFSADKGAGDLVNAYDRDQTFTNTDRLSGRVQFLYKPNQDFNARLAVDVQPNASETQNGRTIYTQTPLFYANGAPNPLTTDAQTRLGRSWFTNEPNYSYAGNYLNGAGTNLVNLNNGLGQVTGSKGIVGELNWAVGKNTVTSITAYKSYHFNAVNDEGTPFDINPNSGGFNNDYKQLSQELRFSSDIGGFVDYTAGAYLLKTHLYADYQKIWGSDAGAYFASTAQYNRLDATAAGQLLLVNSLDRLSMQANSPAGIQNINNQSAAIFGQANWHFTDNLTLTTGARLTHDRRENEGSAGIIDNGFGASLNPVAVNGVQLGGFASSATGALAATNSAAQLALADSVATQYFGVKPTAVAGAAYKSLTAAQQQQVADAKNIRASQAGVIFADGSAQSYVGNAPTLNISPAYKFDETLTAYVSGQYGQKAGISQFVNGVSDLVKPERTTSFELGFKSLLLNKTLALNADLYYTTIRDYQQAVRVVDTYTTLVQNNGQFAYATATGNVNKVISTGLELDATYSGFEHFNIRATGAYNDAFYKSFPNSAQPAENGYPGASPYQDVSGKTLPGASKISLNLSVDYHTRLANDNVLHGSASSTYVSRYNSDTALSDYAWIGGNTITDLGVGVSNPKQTFDVSLIVKNAFGNSVPLSQTWNSYTPANPRWVGIVFKGHQ
ncbi:TonB-dependent receptor [Sapientia aquatica]|uniref:TonB-dependent receptor n=1 Tax=Sapientia aquatica TaxID=1549640 RepID=A0A4R5W232_9BURK|nr:TonB-dependent receptor [Sapientia aquatica]TDK66476.1 TonB-dependent receptor [Sapientia aquatica]